MTVAKVTKMPITPIPPRQYDPLGRVATSSEPCPWSTAMAFVDAEYAERLAVIRAANGDCSRSAAKATPEGIELEAWWDSELERVTDEHLK